MRAILQRILEKSAERGDDWRPSSSVLASAWPGLVGERLAELTTPTDVDWEEGRLTVETASDIWCRELGRRESELLDRIGQVLPWSLEHIEFRVGAVELPDDAPVASGTDAPTDADDSDDEPAPAGRPPEADEDLEQSLESLSDDTAESARRILDHVRNEDGDATGG